MNTHHEKRVRQLLDIKPLENGGRGVIPPAAIKAVDRAEKMLSRFGSTNGLKASELVVLLISNVADEQAVEVVKETPLDRKFEAASPAEEPKIETLAPDPITLPKKRGRPRKV